MKEKLIELLEDATAPLSEKPNAAGIRYIASRLIANGVTINENGLIPTALGFYPEKGGDYLCLCCIDGHTEYPFYMVLRYYIVDKNPHFQHESEHGLKVTHWMCLPDMPKDGE